GSPTRDALEGYAAAIRLLFSAVGHVRLRRTYRASCPHAKRPCRRTRLDLARRLQRRLGLFSTLARSARGAARHVSRLGPPWKLGCNFRRDIFYFAVIPYGLGHCRPLSPLWKLVIDSIAPLPSRRRCRRYPCSQRLQTHSDT